MAHVIAKELAKIIGVSAVAVSKAKAKGRIVPVGKDENGRDLFDVDDSLRRWNADKHPGMSRPHKKGGRPRKDGKPTRQNAEDAPPVEPPSDPPGDGDALDAADPDATLTAGEPVNYNKAAALEKHYKAQLARLEYEQKIGQLVPIENVGQEVEREYSRVRARLLAIPSKLAPEVALQDDVNVCRALIEQAITDALNELAADAAANEKHVA